MEIMFDTFNFPAMYLQNKASLSLCASGRTTGCVIESGDGRQSCVAPVYEGYLVPQAVDRFDLGGRDLTDYMERLLTDRGFHAEHDSVRDIKEKLTYVALDFDQEMQFPAESADLERRYQLPDGNTVVVGNERFRCPEVLFRPSLLGRPGPGLHESVYRSITKCDQECHAAMFAKIVLAGGSTLFVGMAARLVKEVAALTAGTALEACGRRTQVAPSSDRRTASWRGGSILASLSTFQSMWVSKESYEECGPALVHRMCL